MGDSDCAIEGKSRVRAKGRDGIKLWFVSSFPLTFEVQGEVSP
jgi:hypothetical protein